MHFPLVCVCANQRLVNFVANCDFRGTRTTHQTRTEFVPSSRWLYKPEEFGRGLEVPFMENKPHASERDITQLETSAWVMVKQVLRLCYANPQLFPFAIKMFFNILYFQVHVRCVLYRTQTRKELRV